MSVGLTILFLNAGRRVELMKSFRRAFDELKIEGRMVATDITPLAPALYFADARRRLPHSSEEGFIERLCDVCRTEGVNLIIPVIDPDLLVLARHRAAIHETGARVLVSDEPVIQICRDKVKTFEFLRANDFPTPQVLSLEAAAKHPLPLLVKPRDGSANIDVFKVIDQGELDFFSQYVHSSLIQEFVRGDEVTTDVFSDWNGKPLFAVPRRRLKVRGGEVIVGQVERNAALESLCMDVARTLGTIGPINIQAIRSADGSYQIIEINPRFGGGCPLSIAAGAPFAEYAILMGLDRQDFSGQPPEITDGLIMLRFDESLFMEAHKVFEES